LAGRAKPKLQLFGRDEIGEKERVVCAMYI
jgi:hypothetical protein